MRILASHGSRLAGQLAITLTLIVAGCGETGQREIRYPVFVRGSGTAAFAAGDWQVTLDVARIGFGPVYFCATAAASSDLCPAAVAEYAESASIDLLAPAPVSIGEIYGVTGSIRSVLFDYAFVWLDTQSLPRPTSKAPLGHSAHLEGRATRGATTLGFVADVDIEPPFQGTSSVQGLRVFADIADEHQRLDVRFDPSAWVAGIPFDQLAASATSINGPIVVTKGTTAYNAIVIGMTASAPPSFTWLTQ